MVALDVPAPIATVLGTIGRTEDIVTGPNGDRVAIVGFLANSILLARLAPTDGTARVAVESVLLVHSHDLHHPHGVEFLDESTLVIANRAAELITLTLPDDVVGPPRPYPGSAIVHHVTVDCRPLVDATAAVPVRSPGSVAVRRLSSGLVEVYVCNNYVHEVTRHVVARAADGGWTVVDAELLLRAQLAIPDGIAVSPDHRWLAVSNHDTHEVFVYPLDGTLGPDLPPTGRMRGPSFPHGMQFSADGRRLVVADAAHPFLFVYDTPDGDWAGARRPSAVVRVLDDATFLAARRDNPQEGGPKGVAMLPNGLALTTGEYAALQAVDLGPPPR